MKKREMNMMLRFVLLAFMALTLLFHPVLGASNSGDGMSELIGHYVNMFRGQKERIPTKVKLAIVGLPRTGTGSLVEALTLLDYTTLHADEYVELSDLFAALTDEVDPISMQQFTDKVGKRGFSAVYFWNADFIRWAADASVVKVVLTTRDSPTKWAESYESVGTSWEGILLSRPFIWFKKAQQMVPTIRSLFQMIQSDDIQALEKSYINHERMVREIVPEDKLLVFNAKQGWGPLCDFLGDTKCDVLKEQPFPHANERWLLQLENNILWSITWIWPVLVFFLLYMIWSVYCCVFSTKKKAKVKGY